MRELLKLIKLGLRLQPYDFTNQIYFQFSPRFKRAMGETINNTIF